MGPFGGPLRCEVRSRAEGRHRTVSDMLFLTPDGQLLAELRGVVAHLLAEREPARPLGVVA